MNSLDERIEEAQKQLNIAMRDSCSMRTIEILKHQLVELYDEKKRIERSVFGTYGGISDTALEMKRRLYGKFEDHFTCTSGYKWHPHPPREFKIYDSKMTVMTAQAPVLVLVSEALSAWEIIYRIKHQSHDFFSEPVGVKGSTLTSIHEMSERMMRDAMQEVTGIIVHPRTCEELAKSVYSSGLVPLHEIIESGHMRDNQAFLMKDGEVFASIENMKFSEDARTIFLDELDKIK